MTTLTTHTAHHHLHNRLTTHHRYTPSTVLHPHPDPHPNYPHTPLASHQEVPPTSAGSVEGATALTHTGTINRKQSKIQPWRPFEFPFMARRRPLQHLAESRPRPEPWEQQKARAQLREEGKREIATAYTTNNNIIRAREG